MADKAISYEDTFTETLVANIALVVIILILFGILKFIFPSVYMPLIVNRKSSWFNSILNLPLSAYAQRGNIAVIFVLFETLIMRYFSLVVLVCFFFLLPIYVTGTNQMNDNETLWNVLEITEVEPGSYNSIVPAVVCIILSFISVEFYKNFHLIYIGYRQVILRRSAPQNYVLMLDCLPDDLRFEEDLQDVITKCFPTGQVRKILPVPIEDKKLWWKDFHLRRHIRKEQRMLRHCEKYHNIIMVLQTYKDTIVNRLKIKWYLGELKKYSNIYKKKISKAQTCRKEIFKEIVEEDIDVKYLMAVDQIFPQYPKSSTCQKYLDSNEPDEHNVVPLERDEAKQESKEHMYSQLQSFSKEDNVSNKRIGRSCFIVFNSQTEASLASNSVLFKDNTEPSISLAPHPDEVLWYNISATKKHQMWTGFVFWMLIALLFIGYFVPQAYILEYTSANSEWWFETIEEGLCVDLMECNAETEISGVPYSQFDNFGCYLCYMGDSLLITFIPSVISAIFMSILPQIINLLLYIPKYKSKTERNNAKFNCLFAFLILIQGILHVIMGAAVSDSGVLNLNQILELSSIEILRKVSENISSMSYTFLNYVVTKYFFLGILVITRLSDVCIVLLENAFWRDSLLRSRIYKFKQFDYVTQLAYICHMSVIGLMYCIVSPVTIVVVLLAIFSLTLVSRYNIYYVNQEYPESDLSSETDIFKLVINSIYSGFCLMIIGCIAYYFNFDNGAISVLLIVVLALTLLIVVVEKFTIDRQFSKSISTRHLSQKEIESLSNPTVEKFRLSKVSFVKRTSVLYKEYQTVLADTDAVEDYELSEQDVTNIAAMYSHPAIVTACIYPKNRFDQDVL